MLLRRTWQEGYAAGLKRRAGVSSLLWFTTGAIAMLMTLASWALMAQTIPSHAAQHKHELTKQARSVWGMSAPISTLAAQVMQESAFRADAVSWAGARGMTQFMPATAQALARQYPELQPVNEFSTAWAFKAQSYLMRDLVRQYRDEARDTCSAWCYATTAYNGGPRHTNRRIEMSERPGHCFHTSRINPGIRPSAQKENEEYPVRILLVLEPRFVAAGWGAGQCESYSRGN